jgi:type II secretory ATPase GspE/PulE/Tfp pilus assembly ATPase PilB-like protein
MLFHGRGCEKCRGSGYRGRVGLFEVLFVNEALTAAILRDATAEELTEIAVENGMRTLMADGIRKAVEGETTVDEVLRVLSVPF